LAGNDGSTIRQPLVHLQITFLETRSAENEAVDAAGTDRLKPRVRRTRCVCQQQWTHTLCL